MRIGTTHLSLRGLGLAAGALLVFACVAGAKRPPTPPSPPVRYTIKYLGTLPGTDWSSCTAMNDLGEIVGCCGINGQSTRRYFLFVPNADFTAGEMIDLDSLLPSDPVGYAYYARGVCGINNRGQIAGEAYEYFAGAPVRCMAFRMTPPEVAGGSWQVEMLPWVTDMKDMNEDGDIVGGVYSVVVWPAGYSQFFDLGTLYGSGELARGNFISGRDANDSVLLAGEVKEPARDVHISLSHWR